ncbi:MAG: hypothetical protein FJY60_04870, partial [Betaproteobacteria bacterium]|nr:hypothetical protein [Betaproteobacteria bacterium]
MADINDAEKASFARDSSPATTIDVPRSDEPQDDDEISLLDLLLTLARQKLVVLGTPVVTGLIGLAAALLITPTFTSKVVLMPPQQSGGGGALGMLGDLGALAGLAGGALKSSGDLYGGLLKSRLVQDALIDRFKLNERYEQKYRFETRKQLEQFTTVQSDKKSGLITIEVEDKDPIIAANIANAYVDELQKSLDGLAITEAARRRLFFEKQLKMAKDHLADAELALRATQEKTKIILPTGQIPAIFSAIGQMRASIAAKEIEINAMGSFATAQNPDMKRAQQELAAMRIQLDKLQRDAPASAGDVMVPSSKLPTAGLEFLRASRELKYNETLFELLAKQHELAKIDEAKEAALVQVVESAIPAELKSKPKRALIVLIAA